MSPLHVFLYLVGIVQDASPSAKNIEHLNWITGGNRRKWGKGPDGLSLTPRSMFIPQIHHLPGWIVHLNLGVHIVGVVVVLFLALVDKYQRHSKKKTHTYCSYNNNSNKKVGFFMDLN
jgi:hypothetical protein